MISTAHAAVAGTLCISFARKPLKDKSSERCLEPENREDLGHRKILRCSKELSRSRRATGDEIVVFEELKRNYYET